jgi:hypothetical protein
MKKIITSAILLLCSGATANVFACSCIGTPTPCSSYAAAKAVLVGSVRSVEAWTDGVDGEVAAVRNVYVHVEKTFKGSVGAELPLRSYNTSCDFDFKQGQRWLLYAYYDDQKKIWRISSCDRSTLIEEAADDLAFLQGLPSAASATRLSGVLRREKSDTDEGPSRTVPLVATKVNIIGAGHTYEAFTDKNGVYEIFGLPPGIYTVKPEPPPGLKLRSWNWGPRSFEGNAISLKLDLKEKSCAFADFSFMVDFQTSGKVSSGDGKPIP